MDKQPSATDLAALAERLEVRANEDDRHLDAAGNSGEWITGGTEIHREHADDLRLAARCVRAWAKLEQIAPPDGLYKWVVTKGYGVKRSSSDGKDTALAAVEEAQP